MKKQFLLTMSAILLSSAISFDARAATTSQRDARIKSTVDVLARVSNYKDLTSLCNANYKSFGYRSISLCISKLEVIYGGLRTDVQKIKNGTSTYIDLTGYCLNSSNRTKYRLGTQTECVNKTEKVWKNI